MNDKNIIRPFWSWNDRLCQQELESQIKAMKDSGIDGFFMHARGGLETEYMSEEWLNLVEACMDKADSLGMEAWAYDENGWPSGFANGAVPQKCEDFCQKSLIFTEFYEKTATPKNIIACYYTENGKIIRTEKPQSGGYIVSYKVNPYYTDTLNRDAVAYFIENTHERYFKRFSSRFGKSLKGFFTDEPQYGKTASVPWSTVFENEFFARYDYDLLDNLCMLFLNVDGAEAFRFDFYSMVSDLFVNSYLKQIYDWCEHHNCMLTGHMMMEDGVLSQIQATGGVMPCYEYFHIAGIDWLGKLIGSSAVPKQLSSVAYQLGKKTITELFACVGWNISLNELKWIAQWHFVNGVTSLCPHLQGYSLRGSRKRDYPASLFVQLPWFKRVYSRFSDYFSSLGALLDSGEDFAPLLVIHPMHSAYVMNNPLNQEPLFCIDRFLSNLCRTLDDEHIPYHFGDETIMRRHACVCGDKIKVGRCEYSAVLLPELYGIDGKTLELLCEFSNCGGTVYCIGDKPALVDGRPDTSRLSRLSCQSVELHTLKERLLPLLDASIDAPDGRIGYCQKRLPDGKTVYYIVNHANATQKVSVAVKGEIGLYEFDHITGSKEPLLCSVDGGKTRAEISLAPYGSILITRGEPTQVAPLKAPIKISLDKTFTVRDFGDNALTLDRAEYRIDGGEWQPPTDILVIQKRLLELKRPCDIELRFCFDVNDVLEDVCICAETPQDCAFEINGNGFAFNDIGCFVDKSIRRCDISNLLCVGKNILTVKRRFYQRDEVYRVLFTPDIHEVERNKLTLDVELEAMYLIGKFSVTSKDDISVSGENLIFTKKDFCISAPRKTVDIKDLTTNGFMFFSGQIDLEQEVTVDKKSDERYVVELSGLYAPAAELFINRKSVGVFAFAPYVLDVTDYIKNGKNTVTVRMFSGNRNLLGPHHRTYGEYCFVNPSTFTDKPEWGEDPKKPTWTENYSFVRFGIEL